MDTIRNDRFVPAQSDVLAGARNDARDSLMLIATLREAGDGEGITVRVRNLSAGGLMAEHRSAHPNGTPVEVELRGIGRVDGRIAWSAEGRIGIAFDRPIDPKGARKPVGNRPAGRVAAAWPPA